MKNCKLSPFPALILLLLLSSFQDDMATQKKFPLRVMCYNIHHAAPPANADKIDLDAIAKVINDQKPDLVALQEVDVNTKRSGSFNQAEELGKKTGLTAYFFKAIDFEGGGYGVAILSRYPVTATHRYPLPNDERNPGEPRVLGTATIMLPGKHEILFACTHLEAGGDSINRQLQMEAIPRLLQDVSIPIIIAGDFNAAPGSGVVRTLDNHFHRTCDPCEPTIPVNNPKRAIDFVAFSPQGHFKVKHHIVIAERHASDHLPVFAILEAEY
jgi:endonuclease/exonuclease/phosphatase family metal-dependent hydrolase